ncbi:NAD(P)-dependent oxidoreductase [Palleronia sp.]|uniref:NAD(P)-dependent oxidoreductase n=1 Tax=Palleronia sp. TaxID=1940284 RepID=UPI0035C84428
MKISIWSEGIHPGRLPEAQLIANLSDLHPPLDAHEAMVAADRCYFCYDAPCVTACPTAIDIPLFIRQISTGTPEAAARTIFDQNILGGMCARVCPTETLCEESCVREIAEGRPVEIGRLQRYATDTLMAANAHPFSRAAPTGKRVAVVGAGPAGLSCAHRLAMLGHEVALFDAAAKPGGLNEYGIATYKTPNNFARAEVDWLMGIGGIELHTSETVDVNRLSQLRKTFDAVFLGIGLGHVNALTLDDIERPGVEDAVAFIARLRQSDPSTVAIGRDVIVVGGGMTAVDAAVQAKRLGALNVTLAYRGPRDRMKASRYEQDLAAQDGVNILTDVAPVELHGSPLEAVSFAQPTGDIVTIPADQLFLAIGQVLAPVEAPAVEDGRIAIGETGRTSLGHVWAGGDCTNRGENLTVTAVAQGRDAAMDIHATLMEHANG